MHGFISYAHEDHGLLTQLRAPLRAVERAFGISFWCDNRIAAGYGWNAEIAGRIAVAEIGLLLLTPHFIASDYICDKELPELDKRHENGALLVPVVLKPCMWAYVCGHLQVLPTTEGNLKPVAKWRPPGDGFDHVIRQLDEAIRAHFKREPAPVGLARR